MTPSPSFYSSFCGTSPSSINIILSGLTHQREWALKRHLSIITSGSHCHDYFDSTKKNVQKSSQNKEPLFQWPWQEHIACEARPVWSSYLSENASLVICLWKYLIAKFFKQWTFSSQPAFLPCAGYAKLFIFYCAEQPLSTVDSVTDPPLICSLLVQISFHDLNNDANQETNTLKSMYNILTLMH